MQGFFKALAGTGQWYRVPHPLATSFDKGTAYDFMGYQPSTIPKVEWTVKLDPTKKCMHVNFMDKTEVDGEGEFLFSTYSTFKVLEFHEPTSGDGSDRDDPFKITIVAHHDNSKASEDVPSSPWQLS